MTLTLLSSEGAEGLMSLEKFTSTLAGLTQKREGHFPFQEP